MTASSSRHLLSAPQVAEQLGLGLSTLAKMRMHPGQGPKFIKLTSKAVAYDPNDIEEWIAQRRRTSTSTARR